MVYAVIDTNILANYAMRHPSCLQSPQTAIPASNMHRASIPSASSKQQTSWIVCPGGPIPHNHLARALMPRQPYREAVKSDRRSGYILSLLRRAEAWRGMWSSLWLKGDGGIRKNILFFSKAFSKHFPLLIPHHHNLSLFLPGKLHLSFLAILRKEPQQRHFWSENHRWCIIINTKAKAFSWLETFLSNEYLDFSIIYHIHRLHTSKFLPMAKLAPNPYQSP